MSEAAIRLHIEKLAGGRFLAKSADVPCLVAEGRSVAEGPVAARIDPSHEDEVRIDSFVPLSVP